MSQRSDQNPSRESERNSTAAESYSASGVDRSLIHWMLSLSPTERLMAVQQQVNAVQEMKEQIDSH